MACHNSKKMLNPRYKANKKNQGIIPICKDPKTLYIDITCGRCMACRRVRVNDWRVRLLEEVERNYKNNAKGHFVTLTFDDKSLIRYEKKVIEKIKGFKANNNTKKNKYRQNQKLSGYNMENEIATIAIKEFREKIRLYNRDNKIDEKLKYWLVTELGGRNTERIHLHGILWTNQIEMILNMWRDKNGIVHQGDYVNDETVNYALKYVTKTDTKHKHYISRIYASIGLGAGYTERTDSKLNKFKGENTNLTYTTKKGLKLQIPKYIKNKIYNDEERAELHIVSANNNIKWVGNIEVDISTEEGVKHYNRLQKEEVKKAKRLGYHNGIIDKELKEYEEQKREILRIERIQKEYAIKNKKAS